jgi:predicted O-methyltransferase YrrM
MINPLKAAARKLPIVRRLIAQRDELLAEREQLKAEREQSEAERDRLQGELAQLTRQQGFVPAGHFYSPIPDWQDLKADRARIFPPLPRQLPGIDLNEAGQLALLEQLVTYYAELPFQAEKTAGLRYYFENPAYSYSDAILLYSLMRELRPTRVIEVGSGFSSAVMLDTNERFFQNAIDITCIEPYPDLLLSLLHPGDRERLTIIPQRLQDVDLSEFDALGANDILFIDSTHVSKVNSDVNRICFEILPRLAPGVHVHFHDIFYPFEYPEDWLNEGRAWNEAYLLRAFLEHNQAFQIILMSTFMEHFHNSFFQQHLPLCLNNPGGSLWLKKV